MQNANGERIMEQFRVPDHNKVFKWVNKIGILLRRGYILRSVANTANISIHEMYITISQSTVKR